MIAMSYTPTFTYDGGANFPNDQLRQLVADTQEFGPDGVTPAYIFSDQELTSAVGISTYSFQSAMFFNALGGPPGGGVLGAPLPSLPVPLFRTAAILMNALAANSSRLASVTQILDVKLNPGLAAKALRDGAQAYLDLDDNSGAFIIAEQCSDSFSFVDRWFKQYQRQSAF